MDDSDTMNFFTQNEIPQNKKEIQRFLNNNDSSFNNNYNNYSNSKDVNTEPKISSGNKNLFQKENAQRNQKYIPENSMMYYDNSYKNQNRSQFDEDCNENFGKSFNDSNNEMSMEVNTRAKNPRLNHYNNNNVEEEKVYDKS